MTAKIGTGQTALVTGASAGLGVDFARLLARDGFDLVLVARNQQALEKLAAELSTTHGVRAQVMPANLGDPAAPRGLFDALQENGTIIDFLVNNAGFGSQGKFADADETTQLQIVQVNVTALTHLTRLFLPGMLARRRGRIMNVASTAAFIPGPLMAVYYATKAYVLSFSEAIDDELRRTPVTVTAVCPGPTATEFHKRGNIHKTRLFQGSLMDSATVARIGYEATLKGRRVVITGAGNRLMIAAAKFVPRRLLTRIARRMNVAK